ncbi:MAG: hypothetical protein M1816_008031 [Peltula sp. TS41687]|nr:MAG: hypothetical protein M1816_008031 [Peltula sp. TS41687]
MDSSSSRDGVAGFMRAATTATAAAAAAAVDGPEWLGGRLLGEVKVEGVDELLRSLLSLHQQHHHRQQTPQPLFSSLPLGFPFPFLSHPPRSTNHPKSLSIHGPPSSGKTHLLYQLCATSVLPTRYSGQASTVILLDTDQRFDVVRCAQVMRHSLLCRRKPAASTSAAMTPAAAEAEAVEEEKEKAKEKEVESIIENALSHIHVFRPTSTDQLIATIQHIPTYLFGTESGSGSGTADDNNSHGNSNHSSSRGRKLAAVVLDSSSAFYWEDRWARESSSLDPQQQQQQQQHQQQQQQNRYQHGPLGGEQVNRALKAVQRLFGCWVVRTEWDLFSKRRGGGGGGRLGGVVVEGSRGQGKIKLVLRREEEEEEGGLRGRFRAGISAEEAWREEEEEEEGEGDMQEGGLVVGGRRRRRRRRRRTRSAVPGGVVVGRVIYESAVVGGENMVVHEEEQEEEEEEAAAQGRREIRFRIGEEGIDFLDMDGS